MDWRLPGIDLLARDRWIVGLSLAAMTILAWFWLLGSTAPAGQHGAMPGMSMAIAAPFSPAYVAATFIMWFLMMIAMMVPSAAPMILFYARFARTAKRQNAVLASTGLFALSYLAVWAVFSILATLGQALLIASGSLYGTALLIEDRRAAGALLVAVGIYNLTPLRRACLNGCRSPLDFLMRHWRGTRGGAVRLGILHGLYCVGCCWLLMSLLFVGGVMNLAWIVGLAFIVLVEKLLPTTKDIGRWTGAAAALLGLTMIIAA